MPQYTVGCVSYVNAIPLVMRFEDGGEQSPVRVIYDVPSRLPALLESGEAQAILVSSVDALRVPGRRMAEGVVIGSDGPVKSVRLFSKVRPSEIKTLALDASSMTSNRLARIILAERYGCDPEVVTLAPDLNAMLAEVDACVLIGDIGMTTDGTGLHVLDLGEEWRKLTHKPFVWAAWIGNEGLTPELAALLMGGAGTMYVGRHLEDAAWRGRVAKMLLRRYFRELEGVERDAVEAVRERLVERALRHAPNWTAEMVRDYYLSVMVYEMSANVLDGLREFQRRLVANGFTDARHFPALVSPELPEAALLRQELAASGDPWPDWLRPSRGP